LSDLLVYGMPFVLLDRRIEGLEVDAVLIDGTRAAEEAVGFLLELGHRRIAIVTDVAEGAPETQSARLAGYVNALAGAGIAIDDGLVRRAAPTVVGAREQTLELL